MNKRIIPLILALLLSACGFHLRGMIDVPKWLNKVAIISNQSSKELSWILKTHLEAYKIDVRDNPAQANYWIIINNERFEQRIVSIGASTNPRQYQLFLRVEFLLQQNKGTVIKPASQIVITRQLTVNNDRILGSNEEEQTLMNEMRKDAAIQIINRLSRK